MNEKEILERLRELLAQMRKDNEVRCRLIKEMEQELNNLREENNARERDYGFNDETDESNYNPYLGMNEYESAPIDESW